MGGPVKDFVSRLPEGTRVVTEKNLGRHNKLWHKLRDGTLVSQTGLVVRNYVTRPIACAARSRRMPPELLVPRDEWIPRIEERQRKKERLIDRLLDTFITFRGQRVCLFALLNQSPSWYCWCYAMTTALMASRVAENEAPRLLIPESVAGPIMRYRKQGGYCTLAWNYMAQHGVADAEAWPWERHAQANSSRYFEPSRANAALTKPFEGWDLETFDEKMSCLLRDIPTGSCYDREGHARASVDAIYRNGQFGIIDIDSYPRGGQVDLVARMGRAAHSQDTVACRATSPNSLATAA